MINNAELIRNALESVRSVVQQSVLHERARETSRSKSSTYDEEEVGMYSDSMKSSSFSVSEVKRKRGVSTTNLDRLEAGWGFGCPGDLPSLPGTDTRAQRAAPPGRCHSCNRIDTPEWRRGPDGARTLCNACGLHYAKLERKKQLENRILRPKIDEH